VAVGSSAAGVIRWKAELADGDVERRDVLIWNGQILVVTPTAVALHGKDGALLWQRAPRAGSPVAIGNDNTYFETPAHFLQAVRIDDEPSLEDAPLPGISGNDSFLELLWPREKDFIVTATLPDPKYDAEGSDPEPKPQVFGRRVAYGSRSGAWAAVYTGTLKLAPLFVPEAARWIVHLDRVISVDVDRDDEKRFDLAVDRVLDWSADPAASLAVLGTVKGKKVVLQVDAEGVEKWRYVDETRTDVWAEGQPPIGSASGRLVLLTSQRVLAFDAGKLAWHVDFDRERPRRGTLLADGSVLVTSGHTLRKLDAAGAERFAVALPADIVTSPVVDAAGAIYVATASELFSIR
jgi:outer membrane protein assembly factor BamB